MTHLKCFVFSILFTALLGSEMTHPKKRFLNEPSDGIVIMNTEVPLQKPNASLPLGCICSVSPADGGKYNSECILVSC